MPLGECGRVALPGLRVCLTGAALSGHVMVSVGAVAGTELHTVPSKRVQVWLSLCRTPQSG